MIAVLTKKGNKGGQIILPQKNASTASYIGSIEYVSMLGKETLGVEILDYRKGNGFVARNGTRVLADGWSQACFKLNIPW